MLDASPERFEQVRALGALNLKRHEIMFQFVALLYISVPVTIVLGLAEIMPDGLIRMFSENQTFVWQAAGVVTFGAAVYLVGVWRARQLMAVLELWRIERSQSAISSQMHTGHFA